MLDADHPHRDKGGFLSRSKALRLFLQEKKAMHTGISSKSSGQFYQNK
jgi:hypothetical protein